MSSIASMCDESYIRMTESSQNDVVHIDEKYIKELERIAISLACSKFI